MAATWTKESLKDIRFNCLGLALESFRILAEKRNLVDLPTAEQVLDFAKKLEKYVIDEENH